MAYSRVTKIGDGSATQFVVNFGLGYIDQDHITARVGTEVDGLGAPSYRAITFLSRNLLQIAGAPAGIGVKVLFERTVPKDTLIVNFNDGDVLDEDNLDTAQKQTLMAVQEVIDGRFAVLTQDLDIGGFKVKNSGVPVAANDLTNKAYVDERVGGLAEIVDDIAAVGTIATQVVNVSTIVDEIVDVSDIADAITTIASRADILEGTASALYMAEDVFTGDGTNTNWVLSTVPVSEANIDVFIGGSIQKLSDYALIGGTLIITPAVANGVSIIVKTRVQVSANDVYEARDEAVEAAELATSSGMGLLAEEWSGSEDYPAGRRVLYEGSLWYALIGNTNQVPSLISSYWALGLSDVVSAAPLTRKLILAPPTIDNASLNIPSGTYPTVPSAGDITKVGVRIFHDFGSGFRNDLMQPFVPASWPTGLTIQTTVAQTKVRSAFPDTTIIPLDNTVPLISEGGIVISGNYTPRAVNTNITFRFDGLIFATGATNFVAALFVDNDCVGVGVETFSAQGFRTFSILSIPVVFLTRAVRVVQVRIGNGASGGAIIALNGDASTGYFGSTPVAMITANETSVYSP